MPGFDRLGAEIGLGGAHDLQAEIERGLVVERQRADRHAGHARGVLDHRRRNALLQHQVAFLDVIEHAAVGVEAARVVDDDRRLADGADVIERDRQRLVAGFLAENDFGQHHDRHRREEMDADETLRVLELGGERGDRQRRGVGGEDRVVGNHRLDFRDHVGLYLSDPRTPLRRSGRNPSARCSRASA